MKTKVLAVTLIILVHALLLMISNNAVIYTKDSGEYIQQALNLRNYGTWYCGDLHDKIYPELFSQRPPLYGSFILFSSLFMSRIFSLLLLQAVLGCINLYLAFILISKYATGRFSLTLIAASLFFFPSQFIYTGMVMSEILLQTCIMSAVWFLLLYIEKQKNVHLLLFQLSVTAAILTKPVFIAFPACSFAVMMLMKQFKNQRRYAITSHLIPVTVILLVSFVNFSKTGYFEYSSIARKLSVNYNALYSSAYNNGIDYAIAESDSIQAAAATEPDYALKARRLQSSAGRIIGQNFDAYILLTAKGMLNFFIDHSRYDIETFAGINHQEDKGMSYFYGQSGLQGISEWANQFHPLFLCYLVLSVLFNVTLLAGLVRFCMMKQPLVLRLVIAGTIFYVAILTGMTGTTRFRMPVYLLIMIANIIALKKYNWPYLKKRRVEAPE